MFVLYFSVYHFIDTFTQKLGRINNIASSEAYIADEENVFTPLFEQKFN